MKPVLFLLIMHIALCLCACYLFAERSETHQTVQLKAEPIVEIERQRISAAQDEEVNYTVKPPIGVILYCIGGLISLIVALGVEMARRN